MRPHKQCSSSAHVHVPFTSTTITSDHFTNIIIECRTDIRNDCISYSRTWRRVVGALALWCEVVEGRLFSRRVSAGSSSWMDGMDALSVCLWWPRTAHRSVLLLLVLILRNSDACSTRPHRRAHHNMRQPTTTTTHPRERRQPARFWVYAAKNSIMY